MTVDIQGSHFSLVEWSPGDYLVNPFCEDRGQTPSSQHLFSLGLSGISRESSAVQSF